MSSTTAMDILGVVKGLLWAHGVTVAVGTLLWGVAFVVLGALLCVAAWGIARRFELWTVGMPADRWLHFAVLAALIVLVAPSMGGAGLIYGGQRATVGVLEAERVVEHVCKGAAALMIEPMLRELSEETGTEVEAIRVPVADVLALRRDAHAIIDRNLDHLAAETHAQDDAPWLADAKLLVARFVLERIKDDTVGEHDAAVEAYFNDVAGHADAEGTVSAEDFTGVLAARYLEPPLVGIVVSTFASFRYPIYLGVLAILAGPFALFAGIRYARRRRSRNDETTA